MVVGWWWGKELKVMLSSKYVYVYVRVYVYVCVHVRACVCVLALFLLPLRRQQDLRSA